MVSHIPVDISTIQEYLPNDTEEAYIRITTTGHGQGKKMLLSFRIKGMTYL